MTYVISLETFGPTYPELEPLYRQHYAEMQTRLAGEGVNLGPYAPRLDAYRTAADGGWLLTFIVRLDGAPVGYSNVYLTHDMHNGEFIAQEDTIYILPEHRNGIGRKLTRHILDHLRNRGVKRANVTTMTDPRVTKVWLRMGFRHSAEALTFVF